MDREMYRLTPEDFRDRGDFVQLEINGELTYLNIHYITAVQPRHVNGQSTLRVSVGGGNAKIPPVFDIQGPIADQLQRYIEGRLLPFK